MGPVQVGRTMVNPLRCPIVLICLLTAMMGYVHWQHGHRLDAVEAAKDSIEKINLRTTAERSNASILRTKRSTATTSANQKWPVAPAINSSPIPLPRANPLAAPPSSTAAGKALLPPRSAPPFVPHSKVDKPAVESNSEADRMVDHPHAHSHGTRVVPTPDAQADEPRGPRPIVTLGDPPVSAETYPVNRFGMTQAARRATVRGPRAPAAYTRRDRQTGRRSPPTMHRVVDGDTLRRLAGHYLGDEARFLEIFHANRELLIQPDLLPLGEKLVIPRDPIGD